MFFLQKNVFVFPFFPQNFCKKVDDSLIRDHKNNCFKNNGNEKQVFRKQNENKLKWEKQANFSGPKNIYPIILVHFKASHLAAHWNDRPGIVVVLLIRLILLNSVWLKNVTSVGSFICWLLQMQVKSIF